ncbi:MAG: hypothetical protein R3291_05465, partial [Thermoplasmata archaeon]|nr:hypothetical protein [Thermoplasmata archaeon]
MTLFVGLDDTDSPRSMCTTYVATELIARFRRLGWGVEAYPRLVRLNPNIPWKTRGNGALALRLGSRASPSPPVGGLPGWTARLGAPRGSPSPVSSIYKAAQEAVNELADLED